MEGNDQTRLMKKWHGIPVILLVIMVGSVLVIGIHGWPIVGADELPSQIHLTWATNDVYTTMTVSWWTSYEGSDEVLYDIDGAIGGYDDQAFGDHHQVIVDTVEFEGYYHDVELTGLTPGTTYFFICGGEEGWSEECSFRTIGLEEEVSFVFGGDSRPPYDPYEIKSSPTAISNWPEARDWVSTTMAEEDPDFVIFTGDMVDSGNDQEEWADWLEMVEERWVTSDDRMIPIVPVIGNHEMGAYPDVDSSYEYFTGVFALPENSLVSELSELAYSLDFPDLHVTVLCSSGSCVGTWWDPRTVEEAESQVEWLESDLVGSEAEWKVAAFHIPYYSSFEQGTGYASELYLKNWALILDDPEYGVDIVATGHVHNYMRSWPIHTMKIEEVWVGEPWTDWGYRAKYALKGKSSKGVTYIVQGCWGAPTDPYEKGTDCDVRGFMAEAAARPSYTLAELTDGELHVVTKDTDGNVLDDFTLHYTGLGPAPEYNFRI